MSDAFETQRALRRSRDSHLADITGDNRTHLSEAVRFLNFMGAGLGPIYIRTFPDRRDQNGIGQCSSLALPISIMDLTKLAQDNAAGRGVFWVVNAGGQKTADINDIRALFVDFDGSDSEGFRSRLRSLPTPHAIVESSPGKFHVYWLCTGISTDDFRLLQGGLIRQLGTDSSIKDLPRVMRIPGFAHQKGSPFISRLLNLDDKLPPYSAEACKAFARPRLPRAPRPTKTTTQNAAGEDDNVTLAQFFESLACKQRDRRALQADQHAYDLACVKAAIAYLGQHADAGNYSIWQGVGADLRGCTRAEKDNLPVLSDDEAFELFDAFSATAKDAYDVDAVRARWSTLGSVITGPAALLSRAKAAGWPVPPHPRSQVALLETALAETGLIALAQDTGDSVFIRNGRGTLICNAANATAFLAKAARTRNGLRYNELTLRIEYRDNGNWRNLEEHDLVEFVLLMQRNGLSRISKDDVATAIRALAYSRRVHPLRDWLLGLTWDGQKRVDQWLARYLGTPDSEYGRLVGRFFLISMVARILRPGCKVDTMLILEGAQGRGKSTALRILAGDSNFSDALVDIRGKEASQALRGRWLVEIAELAAASKAEAEHIKAFLTRQNEQYRPPFERLEIKEPRQCVIAGTTNDAQYLRDASGGRRFWPVEVGEIDIASLARDREQLFAEAVALFSEPDARWWPNAEEQERLFGQEQDARREEDPWTDAVREYLEQIMQQAQKDGTRPRVRLSDVAGCRKLNLDVSKTSTATNRRLAGIMRTLEWVQERTAHARYYVPR